MKIIEASVAFYIGAYTRVNREGNWVWPGYSVPFLYERRYKPRHECSIEPDIETWKKYGIAVYVIQGVGMRLSSFADFAQKVVNEQRALELLRSCPGMFLNESKNEVLAQLGCPKDAT